MFLSIILKENLSFLLFNVLYFLQLLLCVTITVLLFMLFSVGPAFFFFTNLIILFCCCFFFPVLLIIHSILLLPVFFFPSDSSVLSYILAFLSCFSLFSSSKQCCFGDCMYGIVSADGVDSNKSATAQLMLICSMALDATHGLSQGECSFDTQDQGADSHE